MHDLNQLTLLNHINGSEFGAELYCKSVEFGSSVLPYVTALLPEVFHEVKQWFSRLESPPVHHFTNTYRQPGPNYRVLKCLSLLDPNGPFRNQQLCVGFGRSLRLYLIE